MAKAILDEETKTYLVTFRGRGRPHTRSIKSDNAKVAWEAQARVHLLRSRIQGGIETIPEGVSIANYMIDGQEIATADGGGPA
jgi:hypothetical protein